MSSEKYLISLGSVVFFIAIIFSSCAKKSDAPLNTGQRSENIDRDNDDSSVDSTEEDGGGNELELVDSLRSYLEGSHYYLIYLDSVIEREIDSNVVKDYRVNIPGTKMKAFYFSSSFKSVSTEGDNPFGLADRAWMSLEVNGDAAVSWAAGSIENTGETDFTQIIDDYVLHFSIKSEKKDATYLLRAGFGENNGDKSTDIGAKILLGDCDDCYADFPRDGKWYHFEIPVSKLKAQNSDFNFDHILDKKAHLFDFSIVGSPEAGTTLDLGAIFYYLPQE